MAINPYESPQTTELPVRPVTQPPPFAEEIKFAIACVQLGIGLTAGIMLWAVTAPREAWDVNPYYSVWLFVAGLIAALLRPRGSLWGVLGIYLGQVIALYTLIPLQGAIMPPLIAVLLLGMGPAVVGALLGAAIGIGIGLVIRMTR